MKLVFLLPERAAPLGFASLRFAPLRERERAREHEEKITFPENQE